MENRVLLMKYFHRVVLFCSSLIFAASALASTRVVSSPTGLGAPADEQGKSVAISGDTIAVGAPGVDVGTFRESGVVTIYRLDKDWTVEATLTPDNASENLKFGSAVAVAGNLMVVAAPGDSATTVYTFERSGTSWTQVDRFTRAGSSSRNPRLALSGNTLAIQGGFVFVRAGQGWAEQAAFAVDAGSGEYFQRAVGLDGDRVAFASSKFVSPSAQYFTYVFVRSGTTWTREMKFEHGMVGFSPGPADLALSGDDLIVTYSGAAHAWRRASGTWLSQGTLDPLSTTTLTSVTLDGDRAFVGAPGDPIPGAGGQASGTVYVFGRTGGGWSRIDRFAHPRATEGGLLFGESLAVDQGLGIVGATEAFTAAGKSGAAFVFKEDAGSWSAGAELDLGYSHKGEAFGYRSDVSDNTLIVSAPLSALPNQYGRGAVYLFGRSQGDWVEQARLEAEDAAGNFGTAVAAFEDLAFIGSPRDALGGSVHVFQRQGAAWPRIARLSMSTPGTMVGLGESIAVTNNWLAVGNPRGGSSAPGLAVLFEKAGSDWTEQGSIQASDATPEDGFGQVAAISDSTLVVGAPRAEVGIEVNAGAAYVFTRSGSLWTQQVKLTGPQPLAGRNFGSAVDVRGDWLATGSPNLTPGSSTPGSVFVYARSGGLWTLAASLQAPLVDESHRKQFGISVVFSSSDVLIVGAPSSVNQPSGGYGRAYVYRRDAATGEWRIESSHRGWTPNSYPYQSDEYGTSLASDGVSTFVGAPGDGVTGAGYFINTGDSLFNHGFELP